jgi:hypothetical protein
MVTIDTTFRRHWFGLILPFAISCSNQLDDLKVIEIRADEPIDAATTSAQDVKGDAPAGTSHVDVGTNLDGSEETSDEPVAPTCAKGLLNSDGFCVPEVHCAPGTFKSEMSGAPACAPCASGTFSTEFDATHCTAWRDCQVGEFVVVPGNSSRDRTCESCPDGETTAAMNAGECSGIGDCPAGTFEREGECIECSPGSYCSGKTDEETACEAGTWDNDQDPATPCVVTTSCAAGQFVQEEGAPTTDRMCEFCPSETFSTESNATSCTAWLGCEPGTYVDVQGTSSSDRACKPCASGSFSAADNAASCEVWTTCAAPGHYEQTEPSVTQDRQCGECPANEAAASDNATACAPTGPANLVANNDIEAGVEGWMTWNGGTLSRSGAKAHSGSYSLLVSGPGTGPAAIEIPSVARGATYDVSFWVSVGKVATSHVNITRTLVCGGNTTYQWLVEHSAVPSTSWVNLKGSFTVPSDCTSPDLTVYAEGRGGNVDLYVDNVSVTVAM